MWSMAVNLSSSLHSGWFATATAAATATESGTKRTAEKQNTSYVTRVATLKGVI